MNTAYYYNVTEYESGWGSRPDGYLIVLEKENLKKGIEAVETCGTDREFSRVSDAANFCIITDEMKERVEQQGFVWTGEDKEIWLVKE